MKSKLETWLRRCKNGGQATKLVWKSIMSAVKAKSRLVKRWNLDQMDWLLVSGMSRYDTAMTGGTETWKDQGSIGGQAKTKFPHTEAYALLVNGIKQPMGFHVILVFSYVDHVVLVTCSLWGKLLLQFSMDCSVSSNTYRWFFLLKPHKRICGELVLTWL